MPILSKKIITVTLFSLFTSLVASPIGHAQTILKCGTSTQPSHIYNQAVEYFAKLVAERSKGDIEVQLFPASQLGSERDMVEGLQLGSLEMT